jgi:hypothetical protein
MRADDNAPPDAGAGHLKKGLSHERCGLADGDHAQGPAVEQRADGGIPYGEVDEVIG